MDPFDELHGFMYVSWLAPEATALTVREIALGSRAKNRALGITGLLVFDGQRFCQHFEGSFEHVVNLFDKIANDPRHTQLKLLRSGPLSRRKFRNFDMGFIDLDDRDHLGRLEALDGQEAVAAFDAMCSGLDPT